MREAASKRERLQEIINIYKDYTLTFLHKGLLFGSLKKSRKHDHRFGLYKE